MRKQDRLVATLVGVVAVMGGTWLGLSMFEGHLASLTQLIGAVALLFVVYSIMPQKDAE